MDRTDAWRALALVGVVGLSMSCATHREVLVTRTATTLDGPQVATTSTTLTTTTTVPKQVSADIGLSEELIRACGIRSTLDDSPTFEFDKFDLTDPDRRVLADVATCVTTGPLRGRRLRLVGRADPRGEVEYNMALGEHRASGVEAYLSSLGVPSGQMSETSRGKLDARGTDEASWAHDRRVDLDLR